MKDYRDWNQDFNGAERAKPFYGAYGGEGQNPGWKLDLGIRKPAAGAAR